MFNNINYYNFKNKTPSSIYSNDKECKAFNVALPIEKNWKKSKARVLFVVTHVTSEDLSKKALLSGDTKTLLRNLYNRSLQDTEPYLENKKVPDFSFAAINFNFFKDYHLKGSAATSASAYASARVKEFIASLKPTHVVLCGAPAIVNLLSTSDPLTKFGWLLRESFNGHKCNVITAPDFTKALDGNESGEISDDDESALYDVYALNLFMRCLSTLFYGDIPWSVKKIPVKYKFVDTIDKFKSLYKKLKRADIVSVDTETANLHRINNTLLTIQFSFTEKVSYVLPFLHKDSPFSAKELKYITGKLRKFFMRKPTKSATEEHLVMFNAKFDITVIKQALKIPFMYWPVYDIMAGEHALDETTSLLTRSIKAKGHKVSFGGLAQTLCSYGNDFYYTHSFSKSERVNIISEDLSPRVLEYTAYDTQSLLLLRKAQLLRAKNKGHDKFLKLVCYQYNNNIQNFADMEHAGSYCDSRYLMSLLSENSELSQRIIETRREIYKTKAVRKANKYLLKEGGVNAKNSLFETPFVFKLNKPYHKEVLFFRTMRLKPVSFSTKTKKPGTGKEFKAHYSDNPIIKLFDEMEKVETIKSNFVVSFIKKLGMGDSTDSHLRASFGFFNILTGRSNSNDPNFQNMPERGPYAKMIKRAFCAPEGHIQIKLDASAHEVRCWGLMAFDEVLCNLFKIGRKLRQKINRKSSKSAIKELRTKGDLHKLNGSFFFKLDIEKITEDIRDATKAIVFGCIYGSSPRSIANKLGRTVEFVEGLFRKFFRRFKKASDWLNLQVESSRKKLYVESPIGRRKHLPGYLVPKNQVIAAMERRSKNSPIQGFASDLILTAGSVYRKEMYEYLLRIKYIDESAETMPVRISRMVHDSMFQSVPFDLVFAVTHIVQYCCTKGVSEFYDKHFDIKFLVPVEIDMEFGANGVDYYKWNWAVEQKFNESIHNKSDGYPLLYCIEKTCEDYVEIYGGDAKKLYKEIVSKYESCKSYQYLKENYPILAD